MAESVRSGGTYQTLDEQRERLSPAEERFERLRQTIGLFLGPIVFLALYLSPLPLPQDQQALAAVFSFVIIYWLTEPIPIPVTAVLALALCILFGVAPADDVFGAFSSSTICLFIEAFIIAEAMMRHGLDRRFAFRVLSIPGVSNSTYGVIIAFGAIAALLSAFISNTATAAMLLPIGLGMMGASSGLVADQAEGQTDPSRLRFGTALMLMIAYGASVGIVVPIIIPIANAAGVEPLIPALAAIFGASYGFMLPVSTPPNAIVYGSGMIPITKMVRSGVVFDIIGAILIVTGVTLMVQLVGLV